MLQAYITYFRKHQALETELDNRQYRIDDVVRTGETMVDADHFAADDIKSKVSLRSTLSCILCRYMSSYYNQL